MKPKANTRTAEMSSRLPTSRLQIPTRITKAKTQLAMNPGLKRKNENAAPAPLKVAKTVTKLSPSKVQESLATLTKPATTITTKPSTKTAPVARQPLATRTRTGLDLNATKGVTNKTVASRGAAAGVAKAAAATAAKKTATATANKETTGKAPAAKRIPPYDFKARFNDLLEKHQALKTKHENLKEELGELADLPEKYDKTKTDLEKALETVEKLTEERDALAFKNNSLVSTLTETQDALKILEEKCPKLEKHIEELTKKCDSVEKSNKDLTEKNEQLTHKTNELTDELEKCAEQLFRANYERKELHNTVMDLRGNIRVFCRVRPPLAQENDRALCTWNYLDETSVELLKVEPNGKVLRNEFSFDNIFHQNSTQDDIFLSVSPLIQSALDGYNVCIFAYGQTGSGKTFTMDGGNGENQLGVIPRTVSLLFNSIKDYQRLGWKYEISAQFLEIYNEVLYDLLDDSPKDLEIRMVSASNKTDVYVSNITEETVSTEMELLSLMQKAKLNRMTAATVGNERSSRSHAVTKLTVTGIHEGKNEKCVGHINLVDLAGSESPKTSTRMDETKSINKSLSELSNVILALVQKQDHVPYRNSKLTHLLMPSLGGNSKTLMFVNVAPFNDCHQESVKSLRFAASVNSCKLQKAKKNKVLNQM
ncbi:protein claret segregational [Culicoides brevitarsis]|uniref:protein claret segregational n=1 Tax=Culicoides brevitarsis TaxID=469753 RepID=UPI00307C8093